MLLLLCYLCSSHCFFHGCFSSYKYPTRVLSLFNDYLARLSNNNARCRPWVHIAENNISAISLCDLSTSLFHNSLRYFLALLSPSTRSISCSVTFLSIISRARLSRSSLLGWWLPAILQHKSHPLCLPRFEVLAQHSPSYIHDKYSMHFETL